PVRISGARTAPIHQQRQPANADAAALFRRPLLSSVAASRSARPPPQVTIRARYAGLRYFWNLPPRSHTANSKTWWGAESVLTKMKPHPFGGVGRDFPELLNGLDATAVTCAFSP